MADPLVAYDHLELFLTSWYRNALEGRSEPETDDVVVDRVEPGPNDEWPEKLLVIRDDGTSDTDILTGQASVGVTVYAGTRENPWPAKNLARIVHALASQIPSGDPNNPVASLDERNGPYMIPESQPHAAVYINLTLGVVARAL